MAAVLSCILVLLVLTSLTLCKTTTSSPVCIYGGPACRQTESFYLEDISSDLIFNVQSDGLFTRVTVKEQGRITSPQNTALDINIQNGGESFTICGDKDKTLMWNNNSHSSYKLINLPPVRRIQLNSTITYKKTDCLFKYRIDLGQLKYRPACSVFMTCTVLRCRRCQCNVRNYKMTFTTYSPKPPPITLSLRRANPALCSRIVLPPFKSPPRCEMKQSCVRPVGLGVVLYSDVSQSKRLSKLKTRDINITVEFGPPSSNLPNLAVYAIRTGEPLPFQNFDGPIDNKMLRFPLNQTQQIYMITVTADQLKTRYNFTFNVGTSHELAVQVVALCSQHINHLTRIAQLSTKELSHLALNNQSVLEDLFTPAVADVFFPERYDLNPVQGSVDLDAVYSKSSNNPQLNHQSESWWVSLIVVGLVITAALSLSVLFFKKRRLLKRKRMNITTLSNNPLYPHLTGIYRSVSMKSADNWELSSHTIKWGSVIGSGAFGLVYKCKLTDDKNSERSDVAVKTPSDSDDVIGREQLLEEISVMKQMTVHPNIINLIGYVTLSEPICMISELSTHGDLLSYLHTHRNNLANDNKRGNSELTQQRMLKMILDIISGMIHIHSCEFVHRDLAARNLLLNENLTVKISDFGLTRHVNSSNIYIVKTTKRLPVKWLSIESLEHLVFSYKSDVWSFGVVLYELVTLGGNPYPSTQPEHMLAVLKSGYRMLKPSNCHTKLYDAMLKCWSVDTEARPSFSDLKSIFDKMHNDNASVKYIDLNCVESNNVEPRLLNGSDSSSKICKLSSSDRGRVSRTSSTVPPSPAGSTFSECSDVFEEHDV